MKNTLVVVGLSLVTAIAAGCIVDSTDEPLEITTDEVAFVPEQQCLKDTDCKLVSDYCSGCICRGLPTEEFLPACTEPEVKCFVDPCMGNSAACVSGNCVVR